MKTIISLHKTYLQLIVCQVQQGSSVVATKPENVSSTPKPPLWSERTLRSWPLTSTCAFVNMSMCTRTHEMNGKKLTQVRAWLESHWLHYVHWNIKITPYWRRELSAPQWVICSLVLVIKIIYVLLGKSKNWNPHINNNLEHKSA